DLVAADVEQAALPDLLRRDRRLAQVGDVGVEVAQSHGQDGRRLARRAQVANICTIAWAHICIRPPGRMPSRSTAAPLSESMIRTSAVPTIGCESTGSSKYITLTTRR